MIKFRRKDKTDWRILGDLVSTDELYILAEAWFACGYEFMIDDIVYSKYSDSFKQAVLWRRLEENSD